VAEEHTFAFQLGFFERTEWGALDYGGSRQFWSIQYL
jgi:hypothetical protein